MDSYHEHSTATNKGFIGRREWWEIQQEFYYHKIEEKDQHELAVEDVHLAIAAVTEAVLDIQGRARYALLSATQMSCIQTLEALANEDKVARPELPISIPWHYRDEDELVLTAGDMKDTLTILLVVEVEENSEGG